MNIQIFSGKKNFDVQKAERFFRERRISFQSMDLKKHRLGEREIRLMISSAGMDSLLDRDNPKVREHPACYTNQEDILIREIQENPWLLKTPIVRNGNKLTIGYQPEVWNTWE